MIIAPQCWVRVKESREADPTAASPDFDLIWLLLADRLGSLQPHADCALESVLAGRLTLVLGRRGDDVNLLGCLEQADQALLFHRVAPRSLD